VKAAFVTCALRLVWFVPCLTWYGIIVCVRGTWWSCAPVAPRLAQGSYTLHSRRVELRRGQWRTSRGKETEIEPKKSDEGKRREGGKSEEQVKERTRTTRAWRCAGCQTGSSGREAGGKGDRAVGRAVSSGLNARRRRRTCRAFPRAFGALLWCPHHTSGIPR